MAKETFYCIANYDSSGNFVSYLEVDEDGEAFSASTPTLFRTRDNAIEVAEYIGPYDPKVDYWHVQKVEINIPKLTQSEMDEIDEQ